MIGRELRVACESFRDLAGNATNLARDAKALGTSGYVTTESLLQSVANDATSATRLADAFEAAHFAEPSVQAMRELGTQLRTLPEGADAARRGAALIKSAVARVDELERGRTPSEVAAAYSPEDRITEIRSLAHGSRHLEPLMWTRMSQLLESAPVEGIGGFGAKPDLERFADIARSRATGAPMPMVERDEARTLAMGLLATARTGDVDAALRLKWLLDTDAKLQRVTLPRSHDSTHPTADLSRVLDEVVMGGVGERQRDLLDRYADLWKWHDDAAYRTTQTAAYDAAVGRLVDRTATAADRAIVIDGWERYADRLAGRTPAERTAITRTMLDSELTYSTHVESWLEELRDTLEEAADGTGPQAAVARTSLDLLDANLARVRYEVSDGLDGEVDYAEIGAVAANLDLLDQIAVREASSRAAAIAPAAPNANGAERLVW
jgi:hypothetical protein